MAQTEINTAGKRVLKKTSALPAKRATKREQLIKMLRRKAGVDVPTISEKWGGYPIQPELRYRDFGRRILNWKRRSRNKAALRDTGS